MKESVMQSVLKSYLRGVLVAISPLIAAGADEPKMYIYAVIAGVISPAIRALDKKDPAFGMVANAIDAEVNKLAKADKKKKATKKKA